MVPDTRPDSANGRIGLCVLAVFAGLVLRVGLVGQHDVPRGDVLLDVGVVRSLASGEGFAAGYTRGAFMDLFDTESRVRDRADQHPPLWPLLGALGAVLAGSAFGGLQLVSCVLGVLLVLLVRRETDRASEGVGTVPDGLPMLGAAVAALTFLLVDASANGSLYIAQACLVALLPDVLARARPSVLAGGALLGAGLLLNYQALVLLAVPPLVLALAPPDGRRAAGLVRGLAMVALALLVQVPWWWRNAEVFGHPLYSTNLAYFLDKAGIPPTLALEDGVPVLRFEGEMGLEAWRAVLSTWLAPNLLYLFSTGVFVWTGLLGIAGAALVPLLVDAVAARRRRLLTHVLVVLLLGAVAVLWPATKLRYLVPLTPGVIVLGLTALARRPRALERLGALGVVIAWAAFLVLTRDDWLQQDAAGARPTRWLGLLVGGGLLVVVPLVMHAFTLGSVGLRLALGSGALAAPLLAATVFWPRAGMPSTTYHASVLTPDVFGQPAEFQKHVEARLLGQAAAAARARGAVRVIGPAELLAHEAPALVSLPPALGEDGDRALAALLEREGADHVITALGDTWLGHHLLLSARERWLGGLLEVVSVHELPPDVGPAPPAIPTFVLSRVVGQDARDPRDDARPR